MKVYYKFNPIENFICYWIEATYIDNTIQNIMEYTDEVGELYEEAEWLENNPDMDMEHATEIAVHGFENQPAFNIEDFSNYDVMKEKLAIQVVSTERNTEMQIMQREYETCGAYVLRVCMCRQDSKVGQVTE